MRATPSAPRRRRRPPSPWPRTPFQRGHAACILAATLARRQRWNDTWAALRHLDDALATITEPAPRIRASAAVTRDPAPPSPLASSAPPTTPPTTPYAPPATPHSVSSTSTRSRPSPRSRSPPTTTPRPPASLAAADAERRRRGYRGRLTSAVTDVAGARLAAEHAAAWTDGARLTLEDATALARRTRGPRGRPSFGFDALTPTERLVADHVRHGRTNAEIAAALLVTVPTVKTHLTHIFAKLGVRNRAELASRSSRTEPD